MPGIPTNLGNRVLEETFAINQSGGIIPFRCVILDGGTTPGIADAAIGKIKYPNAATFTNGERILGVVTGPVGRLENNEMPAIPNGELCNVRLLGTVPIITDTTTDTTPIASGDQVSASETSGQAGAIKKTTLSTNAPAAQEHVVGIALHPVNAENVFCLTLIRPQEA